MEKLYSPEHLSAISHELRTPLSAILGLAELLDKQTLTYQQQMYVQGIRQAGNHLLQTLDKLMVPHGHFISPLNPINSNVNLPTTCLPVLLVEDNPIIQHISTAMLKQLGYHVEIANNGQEALSYCQKRVYAAILMDVNMPKMNGIEATAKIRDLEKDIFNTLIIVLTADVTEDTRQACFAAGANEVINKPLNADGLKAIFKRYSSVG